jgi:sn-glycerol 3-phosphate transport system permease protein
MQQSKVLPAPAATAEIPAKRIADAGMLRWKEHALAYLFLAPSLVCFGFFLFYPMLKSIYLSLYLTDPRGRVARFVGFQNYADLFASGDFLRHLKVTGQFILYTVPTGIVWALVLAALTYGRLRGMKVFQFIFSMPIVISVGTGSIIWLLLFHPTTGMLNYFLGVVGADPVNWLIDPKWAMVSVAIMTVWMNMGFNYILLLSGLQGVPDALIESAKIDGAGPLRTFVRIVLPLVSPTLFFVLVVSVIGAFQAFGQIQILTNGGPMEKTNVLVYSIYQEAFINFRFGTGSAQAIVLFAIILILTAVQFKVLEKRVHYQ